MKINFKSVIKNDDKEPNVIEFLAPVEISTEGNFKIYEFVEPQNNVMNRIEVSEDTVNIFAGPSTIVLVKDELIQNDYYTQAGSVMFDSELKELSIKENHIKFLYTLGQLNNPFGLFSIELIIEE